VLEDEILETMAALEEKTQQLPELEKAVRQARDESRKVDESLAARQGELRQRLAEAEKELQLLEARLPPELLPTYARLVNAHGADALAPVQGRSCAGCYTEITSQGFHDLRAERVVFCKSCGRLLYLPEGK
jgi:predicted  nucleic acid-binding Zn-ribbon protein